MSKPDFWEGYVPEPDKRQQALDKKAENARELGLDYEPAQQELDELTAQRDQLADILNRTANALKNEPAELTQHSWHDLPEVAQQLKAAQQEPVAWTPIDKPYPPGGELDILMGDGSILCEVLPQADGDLWWGGASTGERFIDPKYASVTHWRIHAEHTSPPAQRTWVGLTDEELFVYPTGFHGCMRYVEAKLKEKNT